jgi:methylase of polypeptide subunit release factors
VLLEFDERFAVFKEFVPYDFEKALKLPPELKGSFDRIIVDPPFLSEDCQTKSTYSIRVPNYLQN